MNKGLVWHAVLLVGAAILAYAAWTEDKTPKSTKVVLADLEAKDIREVTYKWPDGEAHIVTSAQDPNQGPVVHLLEYAAKPVKKAPKPAEDAGVEDAGIDNTSAPMVADVDQPREILADTNFPAGALVVRALAALSPLEALRDLGEVANSRLESMGLQDPTRSLEIKAGNKTLHLAIGENTYGAQGRYVQLLQKKPVYILPASITSGFEGAASRLMESRLVPLEAEDITEIEIRVGDKNQRFIHVDREQSSKRFFARSETPTQRVDNANTMITRLRGLRVVRYTEPPRSSTGNEVASFIIKRAQGPVLEVLFYENADGSGYTARSGKWFAELPSDQARTIVEDASAMIKEQG